jgi:hypothetical protein
MKEEPMGGTSRRGHRAIEGAAEAERIWRDEDERVRAAREAMQRPWEDEVRAEAERLRPIREAMQREWEDAP